MQDITLAQGVDLVEKGKVTKGSDLSVSGRINLNEYKKMRDPRQQQIADIMKQK